MGESLNEQIEARYAVETKPEAGPLLADRLQYVVDSLRIGGEIIKLIHRMTDEPYIYRAFL
jgi:hypothetical protein